MFSYPSKTSSVKHSPRRCATIYSLLHLFLCVNYFYKIASYPFIKITVRVRAKTWNMFVSLSVTHSTNLFLAMQWGKSLSPSESRARGVAFEKIFIGWGIVVRQQVEGKMEILST